MADSRAPNRLLPGQVWPPTSSTPNPSMTLERATLRLTTGEPLTVLLPKTRPWFNPGERQAAKVRRRVLKRAARRHLESRSR